MYHIEKMLENDITDAVALISRAMNQCESDWARKTMEYHFKCLNAEIDDGRSYFIWRHASKITGLVGLHHYHWGPCENVWLSWFAIDPENQRQGHGSGLLRAIESLAKDKGYRKFFVETYAQEDFTNARHFYESQGFARVGCISNYLNDETEMIVYLKLLKHK